jgi:sulfotransferase family protein
MTVSAGRQTMEEGPVSIVVGPEKTATTFVQRLLEPHGGVALPNGIKETFFFDRFFDNGINWYTARFAPMAPGARLVEVATGYFASEQVIARIRYSFPQARIIILVRDPVERAISHYHHRRRYGYVQAPLGALLGPDQEHIRASLYSVYCPLWEAAFGAGQVRVVDAGVLGQDPERFAASIFSAVGVVPVAIEEGLLTERVNGAASPGNYHVARLATWASNQVKRRGWYALLARLRGSALHGLIYGSKPGLPTTDAATRQALENLLAREREFLRQRYDIRTGVVEKPAPKPRALSA